MFPTNTGRRTPVLDLSSLTLGELAAFALVTRNAQYDIELYHQSALWTDAVLLRFEVRSAFLRRYVECH
jgi:hypothetical protein